MIGQILRALVHLNPHLMQNPIVAFLLIPICSPVPFAILHINSYSTVCTINHSINQSTSRTPNTHEYHTLIYTLIIRREVNEFNVLSKYRI